jgi:hypothetical protein
MYLLFSQFRRAADSLAHLTPAQVALAVHNLEIAQRMWVFAPFIALALVALFSAMLVLTVGSFAVLIMACRRRPNVRLSAIVLLTGIYTVLSLIATIGIDAVTVVSNDVLLAPPQGFDTHAEMARLLGEGCIIPIICAVLGSIVRREFAVRAKVVPAETAATV